MKRIVRNLLLAAVLLSAACSPKVNTEYLNVLPDDVAGIASLDIKSVLEKSKITTNETFKSILLPQLKAVLPSNEYNKMSAVIDNFNELGIDAASPVVFAVDSKDNSIIVAKVADIAKFREGVAMMVDNKLVDGGIQKADGFEYVSNRGDFVMAFNEVALVVREFSYRDDIEVVAASVGAQLASALKPAAESAYTNSSNFKTFWAKRGDVKFMASTEILDANPMAMATMFLPEYFGANDEISCLGGVVFEDGEAILEVEPIFTNANLNDIVSDNFKTMKNISGEGLAMIPGSAPGCLVMGLDGAKIAETISTSTKLASFLSKTDIQKATDYAKTLDGDLTVAITGYEDRMFNFAVIAKLEDTALIDLVTTFLGGGRGVKIEKIESEECAYKLYQRGFGELYYGIKDGYGYAVNKAEMVDNIGESLSNSLSSVPMTQNFDKGLVALSVDAEELQKVVLEDNLNRRAKQQFDIVLDPIDYAEAVVENKGKTTVRIVFDDKETNALEQIVNIGVAAGVNRGF